MEQFSDHKHAWVSSEARKVTLDERSEDKQVHEYTYSRDWTFAEPTVYPGLIGDRGMLLPTGGKHYSISTAFQEPLKFGDKPFVLQYEVKLQEGLECGGAYMKLFRAPSEGYMGKFRPERVDDRTPFSVMFGPDRCGDTDKVSIHYAHHWTRMQVRFIIQHLNPRSGKVEEKHLQQPPMIRSTKLSTLYTLIVHPDGKFNVLINRENVRSGNLLEDFNPPLNSPAEIDDPTDVKPENWVDDALYKSWGY